MGNTSNISRLTPASPFIVRQPTGKSSSPSGSYSPAGSACAGKAKISRSPDSSGSAAGAAPVPVQPGASVARTADAAGSGIVGQGAAGSPQNMAKDRISVARTERFETNVPATKTDTKKENIARTVDAFVASARQKYAAASANFQTRASANLSLRL